MSNRNKTLVAVARARFLLAMITTMNGFSRGFVLAVVGAIFTFFTVMFAASYRWDFAKDRWAGTAVIVDGVREAERKARELKASGASIEICEHFWVALPFDYNDLSAKSDCRRVMEK